MLKIGILSGPENGSPKVLAKGLNEMIRQTGNSSEIFYQIKALKRLFPVREMSIKGLLLLFQKCLYYVSDYIFFERLKKMDAVIICACTPYGFYKDSYNISKLKSILKNKKVLYYAVQYLENSPTIVKRLKDGGHASLDRYDWHLTVSSTTEIRGIPSPPWNQIGLNLKSTGLVPEKKDEFLAVVDFPHPGYERFREIQINALEELNIKYVSLEGKYSLEDIRKFYKKASLFFLQTSESYGLPIAECLACGSYILAADSSWPMAWRLDENPQVHGPGALPECFVIYDGKEDLKKKLLRIKENYHLSETPIKVFNDFYSHYPTFYEGNIKSLVEVLSRIKEDNFI